MAKLIPLGQMTPLQQSQMTPLEAIRYNSPLPEIDYDNPYNPKDHPFPSTLYRVVVKGNRKSLQSAGVSNQDEVDKLKLDGWCDSPLACDPPYETAPGAPSVPVSNVQEMDIGPADELAQTDAMVGVVADTSEIPTFAKPRSARKNDAAPRA